MMSDSQDIFYRLLCLLFVKCDQSGNDLLADLRCILTVRCHYHIGCGFVFFSSLLHQLTDEFHIHIVVLNWALSAVLDTLVDGLRFCGEQYDASVLFHMVGILRAHDNASSTGYDCLLSLLQLD